MMINNPEIKELVGAVVKFAGDSGDGMQLSGTLFSEAAAKQETTLLLSRTTLLKYVLQLIQLPGFWFSGSC